MSAERQYSGEENGKMTCVIMAKTFGLESVAARHATAATVSTVPQISDSFGTLLSEKSFSGPLLVFARKVCDSIFCEEPSFSI